MALALGPWPWRPPCSRRTHRHGSGKMMGALGVLATVEAGADDGPVTAPDLGGGADGEGHHAAHLAPGAG